MMICLEGMHPMLNGRKRNGKKEMFLMMKRMALIVLALMLMVNFAQAESSFAAPAG